MSGIGHPESANLTGYTADYLVQQMHDFRNGTRPDFARRMDTFAKAMTDDEIRQAAEWFAALPRAKPVANLTDDDIVNLAAYAASLPGE
jgi:cytochrome c553